eukprot:CAMPEP_0115743622 /NCGR_PEP_ID=MMETSP0272-20121206/91167_1 /TAXON_ID=71861 /ORGANISM="Scrippsiella trochoidea, Strain CCMP3099" /LENGTH=133 /DNA_ID=CAMNT_0003188439 /DNA_START=207 /DNA_END=605 /DNA_ORIENTATION=+
MCGTFSCSLRAGRPPPTSNRRLRSATRPAPQFGQWAVAFTVIGHDVPAQFPQGCSAEICAEELPHASVVAAVRNLLLQELPEAPAGVVGAAFSGDVHKDYFAGVMRQELLKLVCHVAKVDLLVDGAMMPAHRR